MLCHAPLSKGGSIQSILAPTLSRSGAQPPVRVPSGIIGAIIRESGLNKYVEESCQDVTADVEASF